MIWILFNLKRNFYKKNIFVKKSQNYVFPLINMQTNTVYALFVQLKLSNVLFEI